MTSCFGYFVSCWNTKSRNLQRVTDYILWSWLVWTCSTLCMAGRQAGRSVLFVCLFIYARARSRETFWRARFGEILQKLWHFQRIHSSRIFTLNSCNFKYLFFVMYYRKHQQSNLKKKLNFWVLYDFSKHFLYFSTPIYSYFIIKIREEINNVFLRIFLVEIHFYLENDFDNIF